ncbi:MAG TPA: arylsulfatase, partial [Opitutae bacterium]|nr:arylsulfatase [Opitutae bacterium]
EGIRQGKWKLLEKKSRQRNKPPQVFLFDLDEDVGEKNNLAEKFPARVERMRARMVELDGEIERNARQPWFKK